MDEHFAETSWEVNIPLKENDFSVQKQAKINMVELTCDVTVETVESSGTGLFDRPGGQRPKTIVSYKRAGQQDANCNVDWSVIYVGTATGKLAIFRGSLENAKVNRVSQTKRLDNYTYGTRDHHKLLSWSKHGEESCIATITVRVTPLTTTLALTKPDFARSWNESDVVFLLEGKEVHAHRPILSLVSPVFQTMFTSEFKEKGSRRIELPGKTYSEFIEFLPMLYPQLSLGWEIPTINGPIALRLVHLFHEYEIKTLEDQSRKTFVEYVSSSSSGLAAVLQVLPMAEQYDYEEVRYAAIKKLGEYATAELLKTKQFYDLSSSLRSLVSEARMRYLEDGE